MVVKPTSAFSTGQEAFFMEELKVLADQLAPTLATNLRAIFCFFEFLPISDHVATEILGFEKKSRPCLLAEKSVLSGSVHLRFFVYNSFVIAQVPVCHKT